MCALLDSDECLQAALLVVVLSVNASQAACCTVAPHREAHPWQLPSDASIGMLMGADTQLSCLLFALAILMLHTALHQQKLCDTCCYFIEQ